MRNIELSSVRAVLISICFFLSSCGQGQSDLGLRFAEQIKEVIADGDVEGFRELPCFPMECVGQEEVAYVFGENETDSYIRALLRNPKVEIKIFGPFQYSGDPEGEYSVVYFDPEVVEFGNEGFMSSVAREELWWAGYVETVIKNENGVWGFYRAPFYYGANLPWVSDY